MRNFHHHYLHLDCSYMHQNPCTHLQQQNQERYNHPLSSQLHCLLDQISPLNLGRLHSTMLYNQSLRALPHPEG
jgi:hypothetical protein